MESIKQFGKKLFDKYVELWMDHPYIMTFLETTIPAAIGYVAGHLSAPEIVKIVKRDTVPLYGGGAIDFGEPKIVEILTGEAAKRAYAFTGGFYGSTAGAFKSLFSLIFREVEKQEVVSRSNSNRNGGMVE